MEAGLEVIELPWKYLDMMSTEFTKVPYVLQLHPLFQPDLTTRKGMG